MYERKEAFDRAIQGLQDETSTAEAFVEAALDAVDALEEYQGWANRETWVVSLWLGNEEVHNRFIAEAGLYMSAVRRVSLLEDYVWGVWTDGLEGFQYDLANAALSRVDFKQVSGVFWDV